jgi:hypothetical protein
MIQQAAPATGVALFVANIGNPATLTDRVTAFHRGWWIMAGIALMSLIPTHFYIGRRTAS